MSTAVMLVFGIGGVVLSVMAMGALAWALVRKQQAWETQAAAMTNLNERWNLQNYRHLAELVELVSSPAPPAGTIGAARVVGVPEMSRREVELDIDVVGT